MTAEELIGSLIERLGLSELEPEESGCWRIVFDSDLTVDFEVLDPMHLRMETPLGPLPDDEYRAEILLRTVLGRNLTQLGGGVARNVLFLHADRPILSISRTVNAENSDKEDFAESVEDFVNAAEAWLEFMAGEAASMPQGFAMRL